VLRPYDTAPMVSRCYLSVVSDVYTGKLCPDGFSGLPFFDKQNFQLENRYEAGAARVFAGGACADCDFAVVCVMCVGR